MFNWIFGATRPQCKTCGKRMKEGDWLEDYGEVFCSKECSSKYADTNDWVLDFHEKAKGVLDFRKKHNINRPGAIPQTREGEGGDVSQ